MGLGDLNPVRIVEGKGAIGESGLGGLVIGAGLAAMGVPPGMAALYTGGAAAALTGSLKQGLFTGMGAYGGAGLMGGLQGLGGAELAADEAGKTALSGADLASDQAYAANQAKTAQALESAATDQASTVEQIQAAQKAASPYTAPPTAADQGIKNMVQTNTPAPGLDGAAQRLTNAGAGIERLTSAGGIDALRAQMAAAGGPSLNMAAGTAAAGALGSGLMAQRNPAADAKKLEPGYIRQFSYDPFSQRYTALTPVAADKWGARSFQDAYRAADGGIVALAQGGSVPGYADGGAPQSVADLYQTVLGRAPDAGGAEYWSKQFGDTIDPNEIAAFRNAAAPELKADISNVYQNVLGRDADPTGLNYWTQQAQAGANLSDVYGNILNAAKQNQEVVNPSASLTQAISPYAGYQSPLATSSVDEWVRNTLGREATAAEKQSDWYQQGLAGAATPEQSRAIYSQFQNYAKGIGATETADKLAQARQAMAQKGLTDADVLAQTGKTVEELVGAPKTDLDLAHASQLMAPGSAFNFGSLTGKQKAAMMGSTAPLTTPGDITTNADKSRTVTPNIPGRPAGGFTGIQQLKDVYTQGGGSLGYTPYVPQTAAEHAAMYDKQTGGSAAAYDYLMGRGANPITPYTATGEIYKPYAQSVMGMPSDPTQFPMVWDAKARKYVTNPNYVKPMTLEERAAAKEKALAEAKTKEAADGGLMGMAGGGLGTLGGYSDGGRLLKGPGDGVSDSIPASIGDKQPARLADGEFVVPARIVSELGNGSTDAGARKLYAMMDRVQKARGKTTGKGKVATNSRADKYLPV